MKNFENYVGRYFERELNREDEMCIRDRKDLVWKWKCDSCKHVNEKLIKAWPHKEIDFIALKNLDLNKEEI